VVSLGASDDELLAAIDAHRLGDLAVDLALRHGESRPFEAIARDARLSPDEAARYWRALGSPDPLRTPTRLPEDAAAALRIFVTGRDLLGEEATLARSRCRHVDGATVERADDGL
jgi:hypothetical protein